MPYKAKILLDSLGPSRERLTTWELTYPRFVHAEFMTHRLFSRNAASSRAIPIERMIDRVTSDPVIPIYWGKNHKGMQAREELTVEEQKIARVMWLGARDRAVTSCKALVQLGVHKQLANRLLEPWMWITVICSATTFDNFFHLRCHPDAQPEIKLLADMMQREYYTHQPTSVPAGAWHAPLVMPDDIELIKAYLKTLEPQSSSFEDAFTETVKKVSTARCARVSYLTHDGKRDITADVELHDRLALSGHWSPFEHVAYALEASHRIGNFFGWKQYRKNFSREHVSRFTPNLNDLGVSPEALATQS